MTYNDYRSARNASWRILIDLKIDTLPIMIVKVCKKLGIQVKLYQSVDDNDGFVRMHNNTPIIFVNSLCTKERQRFTVGHELGHIILGHVGHYQLVNREPSPNDNPIEESANVFASRLLAPACILHELKAFTPEAISKLCGISYQSAVFRTQRLQLLEQRNKDFLKKYGYGCFYLDPLELQVKSQFESFIKEQIQ